MIGQTEGTLFFEIKVGNSLIDGATVKFIGSIYINTPNRVDLYIFDNILYIDFLSDSVYRGGAIQTITSFNTTLKLAIKWSSTEIKTFVNGILKTTYTATPTIPAFDKFSYGCDRGGSSQYNGLLDETILYKTALSDSEAIELTTL